MAMVHTSERRPLPVSWVTASDAETEENKDEETRKQQKRGRLGLCYHPGKSLARGRDGCVWRRSLDADVERLRVLGVTLVVTLLDKYEARTIGVDNDRYRSLAEAAGMRFMCVPIIEMRPPASVEEADSVVEAVVSVLEAGANAIVHCRGGVGRAGTIAACVLLRLGERRTARGAVKLIRERRKGAIESTRQEEFVRLYSRFLKKKKQQQQQQM